MKQPPKVAEAQRRVSKIQKLYHEWVQLVPTFEQSDKAWKRAIEIMDQLEDFYFEGEYNQVCDLIDNSAELDLHTQGEYSVMGQDTLWNATAEMQSMAWRRLRSAIAFLDRHSGEDTDSKPDKREQR